MSQHLDHLLPLNVYSTATSETCENRPIPLHFLSSFLDKEWSKQIYATIGKQRSIIGPTPWQVRHPLSGQLSPINPAQYTIVNDMSNPRITTYHPKTTATYFTERGGSSEMLYFSMAPFDYPRHNPFLLR